MDRVRLGRALGYGARHAAKTLQAVAEAAAAPAPDAERREAEQEIREKRQGTRSPAGSRVQNRGKVRQAGRSVWAPLATFSGALWLRVTGLFFALVAFSMGVGVWRLRGAVQAGSDPAAVRHFWIFAAVGILFGYFAVSGFARARARERRGR